MKLPAFEYACPESLAEALRLLADGSGDAKPLAGGQSLMPTMAFRLASPALLVDLRKVPGLEHIRVTPAGVELGAMVRWCDIERDERLRTAHPLLQAAVGHVAHYQIRNRGTVGGSLAHADPAAEMPGIAMACDAEIAVAGKTGTRHVPAAAFFTGALSTVLASDELIVGVRLPAWKTGRRWAFDELARRRGDFAMAGVVVHYDLDPGGRALDTHIGVFGVADRPLRLPEVEASLDSVVVDEAAAARAGELAASLVSPRDDLHASGAYRRALAGTLLERALLQAARRV